MKDCLFCKISKHEIPAEIVYEDDEIIGFKDISPQAPLHVLFVPKKHMDTVNDFEEGDALLIGKLIHRAKKYLNDMGRESYRLVFNCGSDAGQTVYHLHLHCLTGRYLNWPPG